MTHDMMLTYPLDKLVKVVGDVAKVKAEEQLIKAIAALTTA